MNKKNGKYLSGHAAGYHAVHNVSDDVDQTGENVEGIK